MAAGQTCHNLKTGLSVKCAAPGGSTGQDEGAFRHGKAYLCGLHKTAEPGSKNRIHHIRKYSGL